MAYPQYSYVLDSLHGQKFIVITDEDNGKVNLPKGINGVIAEILVNDNRVDDMHQWHVIYQDYNGTWHSFNYATGLSTELSKDTSKEAMGRYIELAGTHEAVTCKGDCKPNAASDTYIHNSNFL